MGGTGALTSGIVIPRLLRRPTRALMRLMSGDYQPPRFAGTTLLAGFFTATALYGMALGGHTSSVVTTVTARTGFALSDIRVSGNVETSEIDVLGQLDLSGFTSLMGLDVDKVRGDIEMLPWISSARVRKVYPSALDISITEREPFAIWQHGEALSVVQADGRVIAPFRNRRNARLPLVIGSGAPERAADFIDTVARFPTLAARVNAYILIAKRRWDIRLDNGVTVKLPEHGVSDALAEITNLDRQQAFLSRGMTAVDMRLTDRIVVELREDEAEVLRAAAREKLGMPKMPGRRT
ncbi:MAG: cell division protein FtsQ/DivIB [Rhizobiaceae bacterium]|nr:cell division protein FtsQ/DivIB [Rhizobiaceae bacterium]MBO6726007.1 cell division protein FtsQ/DivIB [Rhizobiaceae bacterium]